MILVKAMFNLLNWTLIEFVSGMVDLMTKAADRWLLVMHHCICMAVT